MNTNEVKVNINQSYDSKSFDFLQKLENNMQKQATTAYFMKRTWIENNY